VCVQAHRILREKGEKASMGKSVNGKKRQWEKAMGREKAMGKSFTERGYEKDVRIYCVIVWVFTWFIDN
jgi:hypothetical protein